MTKDKLHKAIYSRIDRKRSKLPCWPWTGNKTDEGYGRYLYRVGPRKENKNKKVWPHRIVYENEFGRIPKGQIIRHTCHNPSCCNPAHLIVGTHAANMRDMVDAGRSLVGIKNHKAKLTEKKVEAIRKLRAQFTLKQLAEKFNVSLSTIGLICQGKTWKHIRA